MEADLHGEVVHAQTRFVGAAFDARARQRREPLEIPAQDPLAALGEDPVEVSGRLRIRKVRFADDGADITGSKLRDDPRHPRLVAFAGAVKCRVGVAWTPRVGLEAVRIEVAEGRVGDAVNLVPRSRNETQGDEVLEDVSGVEVGGVPKAAGDAFDGPDAPEGVAKVDVVVLHVPVDAVFVVPDGEGVLFA